MTTPPLTASELFDIVKDCPEVYEKHLYMQPRLGWRQAGTNWRIPDDIATLTLLALFTLAAECGVEPASNGQFMAFCYAPDHDSVWADHPLRAAKAAYKKKGASHGG
jgi:hypothetical protein